MMPIALQVFYIIFSMVILGWAAWITKLVLANRDTIGVLKDRCHGRETWIREIDTDLGGVAKTVERMDRNILRLGIKAGLDKAELERQEN